MTDQAFFDKTRRVLFNTTAARYDNLIMPAFGPLARRLVEVAALKPNESVLDVGTGTGAVALSAAQIGTQAVGIDYAGAMLPLARQNALQQLTDKVAFYQGDMHRLPHRTETFAVALASFGFNGADQGQVFPEIYRVLRPGGRLVFQEWGEVEEASKIVKQAVKRHKVARAEGFLADLRHLVDTPDAWDELDDEEDVARLLRQVGFRNIKILIEQEAIPFEPLAFFRYKTAWTPYQAELAAMPAAERSAVQSEVIEQLSQWTGTNGRFIWEPQLARFMAWK